MGTSASPWRQGWPANTHAVVQPNVLPLADRRLASLGPRPEVGRCRLPLSNPC